MVVGTGSVSAARSTWPAVSAAYGFVVTALVNVLIVSSRFSVPTTVRSRGSGPAT